MQAEGDGNDHGVPNVNTKKQSAIPPPHNKPAGSTPHHELVLRVD